MHASLKKEKKRESSIKTAPRVFNFKKILNNDK